LGNLKLKVVYKEKKCGMIVIDTAYSRHNGPHPQEKGRLRLG